MLSNSSPKIPRLALKNMQYVISTLMVHSIKTTYEEVQGTKAILINECNKKQNPKNTTAKPTFVFKNEYNLRCKYFDSVGAMYQYQNIDECEFE